MPTSRPLGLVLGGGAALGAAHVGVLRALDAHGIRPDVVAGTSAGALIGAAVAVGMPTPVIERQVRAATWSTFGKFTLSLRLGLLDTTALEATIAMLGEDPDIEDLPRPFAAVATSIRTWRPVALTSGPLSLALRASIAVPGLFPPVTIDGQVLVDGGFTDNLPIDAARELGAETVIAVRIGGEWELPILRNNQPATEQPDADDLDTLIIEPDLHGLSKWSKSDIPRLIEAGRVATEKALVDHPITPTVDARRGRSRHDRQPSPHAQRGCR
ncbi:MAG TPA: patatin-like phospholipase family protein [Pseudonocardiaceae bacterium]